MSRAKKRGKIQQPKIATDWKKDTLPPKTLKLKVTIIAPMKTENKTAKKCSESI